MSATGTRTKKPLLVHEYLAAQMDLKGKTQNEIAADVGFKNANIVSMIRQGKTKLPIAKIIPMADCLSVDRVFLFKMVMREYMPEVFDSLGSLFDRTLLTANEEEIITTIREANPDDGRMDQDQAKELKKWATGLKASKLGRTMR